MRKTPDKPRVKRDRPCGAQTAERMRIVRLMITGGGTSGHINPALAIAGAVRERLPDAEILFVGTRRGLESALVPGAGYPIEYIDVTGFERSLSPKNIVTAFKAAGSVLKARGIIKRFSPDVVVGTGGYVSGPVLYAAASLGVPTAIHEQNAYPGVTTRILSRFVDRVMCSMPPARPLKRQDNVVMTGNPVRRELLAADRLAARARYSPAGKPMVLSYGGSGGALTINNAVADMLALSVREGRLAHLHGAGKRDYPDLRRTLLERGVPTDGTAGITVTEYIYDMAGAYAAADLVVCRAGAVTLAELALLGKPAILVPSPNVTENHQYHNAMAFAKGGAAVVIEDDKLTGALLYRRIKELIDSPQTLASMSRKAREKAFPRALDDIADIVVGLSEGRA